MNTLDRFSAVVHHFPLAAPPPPQVAAESTRPVMLLAIVIAIVLLGGALKNLGRAFAPIGELVRLVVSGLAVALLLVATIGLLIAMLVMTGRG